MWLITSKPKYSIKWLGNASLVMRNLKVLEAVQTNLFVQTYFISPRGAEEGCLSIVSLDQSAVLLFSAR